MKQKNTLTSAKSACQLRCTRPSRDLDALAPDLLARAAGRGAAPVLLPAREVAVDLGKQNGGERGSSEHWKVPVTLVTTIKCKTVSKTHSTPKCYLH